MKKILVEYSGFVGSNICMKEKFYELQDNGFYKFKDNVSKQEKNTDNKEIMIIPNAIHTDLYDKSF